MSKPPDHRRATNVPAQQNAKVRAQRKGRWAETLTAWVLRLTGHRILARNYKTPLGEIDVIAKRGGVVAFVEVKARPDSAQALHAITARQRRRIQHAAEAFLIHHPALQLCEVRFDVAVVTGALTLTVLKDAWRVENPG